MHKARVSGFVLDVVVTASSSIATVVAMALSTRLLAEQLAPSEFGAFAIGKRVAATIVAVVGLGMGVTLARYMAMTKTQAERDRIVIAGFLLAIVPSLLVLSMGSLLLPAAARIFFADASYAPLMLWILFAIVAQSIYLMHYALLRGEQRFGRSSFWQLLTNAVGPLLVVVIIHTIGDATQVTAWLAVPFFLAIVPVLMRVVSAMARERAHIRSWLPSQVQVLLAYGAPRVPANFGLAALFAVPALLSPYLASLEAASAFAAVQALFAMLDGATSAIGLVALPKISALLVDSQHAYLRERIASLFGMALHLGLFVSALCVVFADVVVLALLGESYGSAIAPMRIVGAALGAHMLYVLLRSVIDAVETRAVNTRNLAIALLIEVVLSGVAFATGLGIAGLALALAAAVVVLGVMTAVHVRSTWGLTRVAPGALTILGLNAVVLGLTVLARVSGIAPFGLPRLNVQDGLAAAVLCVGAGALYLILLRLARAAWLSEISDRLFASRASTAGVGQRG
jgi:O-antigen/teichoic acid export membrane protein